MKWTISIALLLKDLTGNTKELQTHIDACLQHNCGNPVPARCRHMSTYAIAELPGEFKTDLAALPSFSAFKDAFVNALAQG